MLCTIWKPAGKERWKARMETERGWKARISEKMLNKQERFQPQWETLPQPLQSAHKTGGREGVKERAAWVGIYTVKYLLKPF